MNNSLRLKILNEPSYWVEGINSSLYAAFVEYMEKNNMSRKELAARLGVTKGRMSQILNDGEINFSIEKLIGLGLKVDKFPVFEFQDKSAWMAKEEGGQKRLKYHLKDQYCLWKTNPSAKVIPLHPTYKKELKLAF